MITEIDLIVEKKSFLTNTPFLNEGKVKFLQIKQDKNIKRESVSAYVQMTRDTLLHIPPVVYVLNGWPIS